MGTQPSGTSSCCHPGLAREVLSQAGISDLSLECDHSRVCFVVVFLFSKLPIKKSSDLPGP